LTERLSPARLAGLETDFPGGVTHEALTKLADITAFLQPPAADIYPAPPPDAETQQRMLSLAVDYIKTTVTRLPNFYAIRDTTHFEDTPSQQVVSASGPNPLASGMRGMRAQVFHAESTEYKSLHSTGEYSTVVTYRDGFEVHDSDTAKSKKEQEKPLGLTTSGEFGPILSVVMGDAMRSQVTWLRWEQTASGPVGVFHYTVPDEQSNYTVHIPNGKKLEEFDPGYHGEITIDPATGDILRLSVEADLKPPYETMKTAILVEYAPVEIGAQTYICPVRGVAYAKTPVQNAVAGSDGTVTVQTQLNDVAFTHYHLFRTEARIVEGGSEKSDTTEPDSGAPPAPVNTNPVRGSAPPESKDR
jgi:hypothetical protein